GRVAIAVGLAAMIISIFLGTLIGVLTGYFKSLDGPLMRLTDLFLSLPVLPLLLVAVMLFRDAVAKILGN
ncbi:MAG: ABC transporter permease, partial [Mesorhizobium sp.]